MSNPTAEQVVKSYTDPVDPALSCRRLAMFIAKHAQRLHYQLGHVDESRSTQHEYSRESWRGCRLEPCCRIASVLSETGCWSIIELEHDYGPRRGRPPNAPG